MRLTMRIIAPLVLFSAILLPAGGATAAPAQSTRTDVVTYQLNDCNGDFILAEGTSHSLTKFQEDGTIFVHSQMHVKGVGPTGIKYVLNYNDTYTATPDPENYQTITARARLISNGSAPNQVVILTYNSVSGPTAETDCRG